MPTRRAPSPLPEAAAPRAEPPPAEPSGDGRDVAADMLRGLAIVVLVVNHIHLRSQLEYVTGSLMSAAEVLVLVSGGVAGMVYGRRWAAHGGRATTRELLRRARKLHLTSVAVILVVGALALVPGVAVGAVTAPGAPSPALDVGSAGGLLDSLAGAVTLAVGPWQFCILGFFIAAVAVSPAVLWALHRPGGWAAVLALSWTVYAIGRAWPVELLPAQSERPFPFLTWQVLFVNGMVAGHHRRGIAAALRAVPPALLVAAVAVLGLVALYVQFRVDGRDPLGLEPLLGLRPEDWTRWTVEHYDKPSLDPARMGAMTAIAGSLYLGLRLAGPAARRAAGWLLLPLGRNSFYVFTMHVFLCLGLASLPPLAGDGPGGAVNAAAQIAAVALLWTMVRRRFLFRWVPR